MYNEISLPPVRVLVTGCCYHIIMLQRGINKEWVLNENAEPAIIIPEAVCTEKLRSTLGHGREKTNKKWVLLPIQPV